MKLLSFSLLLLVSAGTLQSTVAIVPVKFHKSAETIKVFPTPDNEGSITISSVNRATLQFYLFDLEGKLIYQTTLKKHDKKIIEGLTKGTYLYDAFQNDESIKGGKIILK
ncbi:MAG TPA: T9SS type A sorting domain-containing protein [Flavisolibacter sp.]|nr:T9SS type A sorting domain-containing protein [Flavisolibacter sp.]